VKRIIVFICLQIIGNWLFALDDHKIDPSLLSEDGKIIYETVKQIDTEQPGIQINSGIRDIPKQAEIMRTMPESGLSLYKGTYVAKIKEIRNSTFSNEKKETEIAKIITKAREAHSFVSRHLDGDAIDIQKPEKKSDTDKLTAAFINRGFVVINEAGVGINCLHLAFAGKGTKDYENKKRIALQRLDEWKKPESSATQEAASAKGSSKKDDRDSLKKKKTKEGGVSMKMDISDDSFKEGDADVSDYLGDNVFTDDKDTVDSREILLEEVETND
jgi:hypothetical protein